MRRSHFLVVAVLASMAACSDNPNPVAPIVPGYQPPSSPAQVTVAGRIAVSGTAPNRIIELVTTSGGRYRLVGTESNKLACVDGGEVLASGTLDANPGLVVDAFQVTAMHGRSALDGILEARDGGYVLRLQDGSIWTWPAAAMSLGEPPVGARLWVVGSEGDLPVEFGIIADQQ